MTTMLELFYTKSESLIDAVMKLIPHLPHVKAWEMENKETLTLVKNLPKHDGGYYSLSVNWDAVLTQYLGGFICGYMAGIGFDNSK